MIGASLLPSNAFVNTASLQRREVFFHGTEIRLADVSKAAAFQPTETATNELVDLNDEMVDLVSEDFDSDSSAQRGTEYQMNAIINNVVLFGLGGFILFSLSYFDPAI